MLPKIGCCEHYWVVHHCTVRFSTVHFRGVFHCTWFYFSTTSAGVPSDPYRYQNMTCKLYWSLISRRKSSLLRHWTCDTRLRDPLDLNQHLQRRIRRCFCINPNMCFMVCWGDVPLVDSRGGWMKKPYVYFLHFVYFPKWTHPEQCVAVRSTPPHQQSLLDLRLEPTTFGLVWLPRPRLPQSCVKWAEWPL